VLVDELQSKLGGEGVVIQNAVDVEGRMDLRRPSGILSLDVACGGGLPAGGLSQIDGKEGVGKNLLMNHYFAMNQRIYKENSNIFMLCLEFGYDKLFGRACGVKVGLSKYEIDAHQRKMKIEGKPLLTDKEVVALQEQTGRFDILRGSASEKLLEGVVEMIRLNSYQVGGIDSWDAMLTAAGDSKDLEENAKVADASNIQTRWMVKVHAALSPQKICPLCGSRPLGFKRHGSGHKYECVNKDCGWTGETPYMWENETTIIGIRQVRANMNKANMHAREYKVGGANALQHGKLIDIQLRPGEYIKRSEVKIGKEINWELTKGKSGTHEGIKGMYQYFYKPPEIDVISDLVNYCMATDVIFVEKGKKGLRVDHKGLLKEEPILVFSSKEILMDEVEEDKVLQNTLRKLAYAKAELGHVRYS
jgi:hypothetical protein